MSIAVRPWSEEDLKKANTDEWEATLLMNKCTFSTEEIKTLNNLPFKQRVFELFWDFEEGYEERVIINAPNLKMLRRFIKSEYNTNPHEIFEVVTRYKEIQL